MIRFGIAAGAVALLLAVANPAVALDRTGKIAEARVYFDNGRTLDHLGDLAGELDICTWQEDESGGYLVINTDDAQLAQLRAAGLRVEVTWPDVRDKFRFLTGVDPDDIDAGRDFGCFLTYYEMEDTLDWLVSTYPDLCVKFSAGVSYQGRQLWGLKISDNPGTPEDEPACFFNGATHAREPMGTHALVLFAEQILSEYGIDPASTWLVDNREIYLVPVMNPDGYVYNSDSGGASSNWRKNRRVIQSPYVGVDLNRNYGYKWGYDNQGSSGNPSSETYRGPSAFSEPAVAAIRDFCNLHWFRTQMDFHTYGRYNMYPWGFTTAYPPEQALLQEMVDTFRLHNGYPVGNTGQISRTLYRTNGTSVDWEFADTAGKFVSYAFTCELSTNDFWYGWNNPTFVASECALNIPNLYYLARLAGTCFEPAAVHVNDSTLITGNSSGELDPGETAALWFELNNRAVHPLDSAYNITGRLVSGDPLVEVLDSVVALPNCPRLSTVDNQASPIAVHASPEILPGTHVELTLTVSYMEAFHSYSIDLPYIITIGDQTAVEENAGINLPAMRVFPNPAGERVNFALAPGTRGRLEVYSAAGRLVAGRELESDLTLDCRDLPAGVYFAQVTTPTGRASRSFTVGR